MNVQLDLLHREHLRGDPELFYAERSESRRGQTIPAELLDLLVLEADGTVVPVTHGLSRRYKLCNVKSKALPMLSRTTWQTFIPNSRLCAASFGKSCARRMGRFWPTGTR